ncbi:MAG: hypothetical protein AAF629_11825 [Chloroflexota bacterium]
MCADKKSGQEPFVFTQRKDLNNLPAAAQPHEVDLHGGFDIDNRPGFGQIYYGMPGCGIMRIDGDLGKQEIISLPDDLKPLNFHSTKVGNFDGQTRLIMPANGDQKVAILTLEGEVDFVLPRPTFEEYQDKEAPYSPTDAVLVDDELYIADGYGSNYISAANVKTQEWTGIFGGKTDDKTENGKFATAHGINLNPVHNHLDIADRPHSRVQTHHTHGGFIASHNKFPQGAFLCGISYLQYQNKWYAVIGCLKDPDEDRPAPIYILDAETYELLSTIRPKEELGIELAQHLHNVMLHVHNDELYLICQAWNPGHYFVLQKV